MNLLLVRDLLSADSTEGILYVDGTQECYTLELPVKDGLPGSAIPPGNYPVILALSPKFSVINDPWVKQYADEIPHLQNIPGRSNILIHWGNDPSDTEGCILVGQSRGENFVGSSRAAFEQLHEKLLDAATAGEGIMIEIQGGIPS